MGIDEVEPHYMIVVDRKGTLDVMEVQVEVSDQLFSDEVKHLQEMERKIAKTIKEYVGVSAKVKLVEPKSIARSEGKAVRVVDERPPTS